ncbi:MAG: efflux RND transporter periplasmic adaptor subunit [Hyphomicrobiaceae bacterium]
MAPKDTAADKSVSVNPDAVPAAATAAPASKLRRYFFITLIGLLGPLAALALGVYIYLAGGRYVSTDNAYVKSAKIVVSANVAGRVTEVAVRENQTVSPGDLLFGVDPAPFRIAQARAKARLLSARQGVEALRAAYQQQVASLTRAQGEVVYHRQQLARQKKLSRRNLVSGLNLDTAVRNLRDAEDQVKVTEQGLAAARAKLGGDPAIPVDRHPDVQEAKALFDQAALDLAQTAVRATMRGVVTNFDLQPGEYVKIGNPIFSLVAADNTWVHANYKETELTHVRVGQRATISIDTYPDRKFEATVSGISPATGAEFAVLPPQNATGNWVKVVQRLTVRLRISEPGGEPNPILRAGMSAIVTIDTGHKRRLPGMFAGLADWAGINSGSL